MEFRAGDQDSESGIPGACFLDHVLFDPHIIEIFDPDGTLLGSVAHPGHVPAGTFKVLTIRPWHPHRQ